VQKLKKTFKYGDHEVTLETGQIEYIDEDTGEPCLRNGGVFSFKPGSKWEVIKNFNGRSHERGGIDIAIDSAGIKMSGKNGGFKAKYGMLLTSEGLKK